MSAQSQAQSRRDEFFDACDAIAEEGGTPTVRAIIDRIGGSATTATRYLREWKARKQMVEPEAQRLLEDAYLRLSVDVLARVEAAEKRAEAAEARAEQREADARQAELERDQAQADAEAARQQAADAEAVRTRAAREISMAETQREAAADAQKEAEKAQRRADVQARELAEATERLTAVADQVEHARAAIDQRVRRITEGLKDLSDRQRNVDEGQAYLAEKLGAQDRRLSEIGESIESEQQTTRGELKAMAGQVRSSSEGLARQLDQSLQAARKAWREDVKEQTAAIDRRLKGIEAAQGEGVGALSGRLDTLVAVLEQMEERLQVLEDRVAGEDDPAPKG